MPIYNIESHLVLCLDSICGHTLPSLEKILVDDGSTDASGKIEDCYTSKDPRIVVVHKENSGISFSRNEGLKHVIGSISLSSIQTIGLTRICPPYGGGGREIRNRRGQLVCEL